MSRALAPTVFYPSRPRRFMNGLIEKLLWSSINFSILAHRSQRYQLQWTDNPTLSLSLCWTCVFNFCRVLTQVYRQNNGEWSAHLYSLYFILYPPIFSCGVFTSDRDNDEKKNVSEWKSEKLQSKAFDGKIAFDVIKKL